MVWLIGCNGMLGSELGRQLTQCGISWIGSDREVDITDPAALEKFASSHESSAGTTGASAIKGKILSNISWVINCAAYTAVDKAEDDEETARRLNEDGPRNIARAARKIGARLIHISTDYVFDGTGRSPYTEDAEKNPACVYGLTKAAGEDAVQKEMTQYYIIRTAWLYGFDGKNFVYTMARAMSERDSVTVVADQKGTPTFAGDLASAIIKIIDSSDHAHRLFGKNAALPYGVYHFTDSGETTWFGFAQRIYALGKKYGRITGDCEIKSCSTEEYPTRARRPAYSVLSKEKIQGALRMKIPEWDASLEKFMRSGRFSIM